MFKRILLYLVIFGFALGGLELQRQINELPVITQQVDLSRLYGKTSPAVVWIGAKIDDYCIGEDPHQYTIKWQGSGFLVSADGLIATAGHVVEDTESFEVMFQDGTRIMADFVHMENMGTCDVGFIKLRDKLAKDLPYFKFDTEIKIGEDIVILGYPWGLNNGIAMTKGIVSLFNRDEPFFGTKLVVHVDAASYPGNSGSPVVDMDGECIGILIGGVYECDNFSIVTSAKLVKIAMCKALAKIAMGKVK